LNDDTIVGRDKSPEKVIREIEEVVKRYQVTQIKFTDNILSMRYFHTLLPKIQELNCDLLIFYETKANLKKEQVRLLRAAGVRTVQAGIESVNSRKLHLMDKGVTGIQNIQLLKWAAEFGVYVVWNWLYGFPGETDEDLEQEFQTMQVMTHLYPPIATSPLVLERFSPYFVNPTKFQIQVRGPEEYYRHIFPFSDDLFSKFAYTFDYEHLQEGISFEPLMRIKTFINSWRRNYKPHSLYVKRGYNCIHIYDQRFNTSPKRVTLKGERKEIYLYCDMICGLQQIKKHLEDKFQRAYSEASVNELLQELIELKLMYRERDRYLSLAIPFSPDHQVVQIARDVIAESLSNEMTQG